MHIAHVCPLSTRRLRRALVVVLLSAVTVVGCDKAQLLAPTRSTISISAPASVLPSGGTAEITAYVVEQAGTPVQNGTVVRFTTTLGTVNPVEAQTRNGVARTIFSAGDNSGIAEIRALSGGATGGTDSAQNTVKISVGAAAVSTITLRANPGSVGPSGGSVELIASTMSEGGQGIGGVLVTFSADQGSLSQQSAITNASGEARTTLTTGQQTVVSATAGAKTSASVTIPLRAGPIVTIACAVAGSTTTTCGAVQASAATNTATVIMTVTRATGSSPLRSATLEFGDGESVSLGTLAGGSAVVAHAYAGPSASTPRTYIATVRAEDTTGEVATSSTSVSVSPRAALGVTLTATSETATTAGQRWTFTATATGVAESGAVQSYIWNFGDGSPTITTSGGTTSHVYTADGVYTVSVTMNTTDGRSATATTQLLINVP